MRRALVGLALAGLMLVPTPALAVDESLDRFMMEVVAESDLSASLGQIDIGDPASLVRIRAAIAADHAKMVAIVPSSCWIEQYAAYVETLALYGLLVDLVEAGDAGAVPVVLEATGITSAVAYDSEAITDCF